MLYRFLNYTISYKIIFGDKNQMTEETQTLQMIKFDKNLMRKKYEEEVFKRETHPADA